MRPCFVFQSNTNYVYKPIACILNTRIAVKLISNLDVHANNASLTYEYLLYRHLDHVNAVALE